MNCDSITIGKRIQKERIGAEIKTQSDLACKLGYSEASRQTIWNWETGKRLPSLDDFMKLCEIFNCELGYLLCEYDCKTREAADIVAATGLSENAVNKLILINKSERREVMNTLSLMIEHEDFLDLLSAIHIHFLNFKKNHFKISVDDANRIADIMGCEKHDVDSYMEASSKALLESLFMRIIENLGVNEKKSRQKTIVPTKSSSVELI